MKGKQESQSQSRCNDGSRGQRKRDLKMLHICLEDEGRGHKPWNASSSHKVGKADSPWSPQKEHSSTDALIHPSETHLKLLTSKTVK